ncbi:MAG: hypothetical protein CMJ83_11290 [Planctomycetes bacterium]|nr:hypothetical protein [Planctomycetota bacterium]
MTGILSAARIVPLVVLFALHAVAQRGRTLAVPKEYPTLTEALLEASPGAVVLVDVGTWDVNTELESGITIRGKDMRKTVLRGKPSAPVIIATDADKAHLENLTLEHPLTEKPQAKWPVIGIEGGSVTVSKCIIRNGHGPGVLISGAKHALLDQVDVIGCASAGVRIRGGKAEIKGGSVNLNQGYGIHAHEEAQVGITRTTLKSNGKSGVRSEGAKTAVTITDVTSQLNEFGASCIAAGAITVKDGRFEASTKDGLYVRGPESSFDIAGGVFNGNGGSGMSFTQGAGGKVTRATANGNRNSGLAAAHRDTRVTFHDNVANDNVGRGIFIQQAASAVVTQNTCETNKATGIGVYDKGTVCRAESNRCRENEKHGISYSREARGEARGNVVAKNKMQGFGIFDKAQVTAQKNHCLENILNGIQVWKGGRGILERNVCDRNQQSGISISGAGSEATFKRNKCRHNGFWGVSYEAGADRPEVGRDNELSKNKRGKTRR